MCRVLWRMCNGYLLLLLTFMLATAAHGSGYFELQILEIQNYRGEVATGECCGGGGGGYPGGPQRCRGECSTLFRVCLKEYQSSVSSKGSCSFGTASSPILGGNSFTLADPDRANARLKLPFSFRWTRSFTLILHALDLVNNTLPGSERIIEEATYSGIILPSSEWHTLNHNGKTARIIYRVRVQCDPNYYNATCTKFCRPRNDKFGHYNCDKNGDKECITGWRGANCEDAVCKKGCHEKHGKCDRPGDCECRPGWRGEFCDECQPYPGCKHGYCNGSSWQCICDTNWGGILCDRDLNYCGTHEPCLNGGTCENTAPDKHNCTCPEGFSGLNCEIVDNPCATAPCRNGGTCIEQVRGLFSCTCALGWSGATCTTNVDECASSPCTNGGTCVDLVNGFRCICPSGWEGNACQYDVDECQASPCINAISCHNMVGGFHCECQKGWSEKTCDRNINDCVGQCENGATCIDLVNDYHCACQPGYTGRNCHIDTNECESSPCRNGGECVDLINGFRCICPVGYTGAMCEVDHDQCNPNPCKNDAPCFNTQADYYCHCSENWEGKNCSSPRITCNSPPCDAMVDSCAGPGDVANSTALVVALGSKDFVPSGICGEHGRCISQPGGGFRCVCDPGYTGQYCHENINDCKLNPCQNGGTCVDKVNSFQCICKEGWEGNICSQNKNECEPNPCRNNGTCIDGIADYVCSCRDGWKGKTCNLKDSHCDQRTCRNGGTCQDLGDTYVCRCTEDWEGTTCHIAKTHACKSDPCLNGATCVNTGGGDQYSCICKEGFEGNHCEQNVDDCNPAPCFNGGRCVDGVNWFLCECARGFTGPDCRININECATNPCGAGGTCLDGIGEFQCICPTGLKGARCEEVDGASINNKACYKSGKYYFHNQTWNDGCNECTCHYSKVHCSHVWCGMGNCLGHSNPNEMDNTVTCQPNEVCVPTPQESCLSPGCMPWGECRAVESGRRVGPPVVPAPPTCWPNQAQLSNTCSRLGLLFDRSKLQPGLSVEGLCSQLRQIVAHHQSTMWSSYKDQFFENKKLIILCDLKAGYNDTVEVTMSSEDSQAVSKWIKILGEYISRKQTNVTALTAIVEVKLETALVSEEKQGNGYLIALICIILTIIMLVIGAILFYWRQRRCSVLEESSRGNDDGTDLEKSNNLQNEENLRRYTNPLKVSSGSTEEGTGGSGNPSGSNGGRLSIRGMGGGSNSVVMTGGAEHIGLGAGSSLGGTTGVVGGSGSVAVGNSVSPAYSSVHSNPKPMEVQELVGVSASGSGVRSGSLGLNTRDSVRVVSSQSPQKMSSGDSTEMMEIISEAAAVSVEAPSQGISSQIFKAQSPDVRKNTLPPVGDSASHKDFAKHMNLKSLPLQRTPHQDRGDVLTVIV
ncbi:protein jagged-1b-like [Hetaerina americana]|uniref:protein jagged-1b-like n=1 Tax=Hetaerina americana TaxID=62018 RepID=UPI003A7F4EAA